MTSSLDQLLSHLGKPGKYQLIVCFFLCCNYFQITFNHLAMVFFGSSPLGYFCGEAENASLTTNTSNTGACRVQNETTWCKIKDNCTACGMDTYFKMEEREWTLNAEFGLVCGEKYKSSLATSIYFLGVMLGGIFFGYLADVFGRLPTLVVTLYLPLGFGLGIFFSRSYLAFILLRFCIGFLMQGQQIVIVSLIMEYFSPEHRGVALSVFTIFWGVGVFIVALIAFLVRNWRWMQLCFSLVSLISIFYIWLIPESLRWLLTKKKYQRANKLVERIARFNGLKEIPQEATRIIKEHTKNIAKTANYSILDIFKHRTTLLKSVVLWYIWFSASMGYYGLSFNTGTLYGFKYTNFLISASVEIAAYCLAIVILYHFGRRHPLAVYFLLGGLACIVSGVLEDQTWKTVMALVGRFGIAGAFSILFVYTPELYPTVMRSIGFGSCTFWTRLGGLVAPQINLLGALENSYPPLPVIIFGILSIFAAFLTLSLPETHLRKLPDVLKESDELVLRCCKKKASHYKPNPEVPMGSVEVKKY